MTDDEFMEMIRKTEEELENDPGKARKIDAEMESIKKEHSEYFDKIKNKTLGDMTRDELEEMFKIVGTHVAKIKRAN